MRFTHIKDASIVVGIALTGVWVVDPASRLERADQLLAIGLVWALAWWKSKRDKTKTYETRVEIPNGPVTDEAVMTILRQVSQDMKQQLNRERSA